jgi:hypothetical protein
VEERKRELPNLSTFQRQKVAVRVAGQNEAAVAVTPATTGESA